ncbi:MAG: ACP S-malonyltransferase [Planctomycetes bacterium]|nr:ACP S-malonyltransferase [Planctomycetota bacterium]
MKRVIVFPGQGAQYVGMGMELAERYPAARDILDEADAVLGFSLSDYIAHGPEEELTRTDISQPAILTVSWMAFSVLKHSMDNLQFDAVAGLSLGEYTALLAAGVMTYADAISLVRIRGQAMQAAADAQPSGMVALIGTDESAAVALCEQVAHGDVLTVANLNSPGQVVISGDQAACDRAVEAAKEAGIRRAMPLPVAGAFHSPLMESACTPLRDAIQSLKLNDPKVPVYCNVTAAAVTSASDIEDLLVRQLCAPVRWAESIEAIHAAGIQQFWELGPGKTLSGMIKRIVKDVDVANLDKASDVLRLAQVS